MLPGSQLRREPGRLRLLAYSGLATVLGLLLVEGSCRIVEALGPPGALEAASPLGFQQLPVGDLLLPVDGHPGLLRFAPGLIDDSALLVPPAPTASSGWWWWEAAPWAAGPWRAERPSRR